MTPTCIDLQERFGRQYRISHDDAASTWGERTDPWMMTIPCRWGVIYPHGANVLALELDGHPKIAKLVASNPGIVLHQDGDEALWSGTFFQSDASEDEKKSPAESSTIGRQELLKGLDGMSRVAEKGSDPFFRGHTAAAVMSSAFFCREEKIDERTQKEIRSFVETRLMSCPIYAPRPKEKADPELVDGLVKDLDAEARRRWPSQ
jgi:hypothetical protein